MDGKLTLIEKDGIGVLLFVGAEFSPCSPDYMRIMVEPIIAIDDKNTTLLVGTEGV